MAIKRSRLRWPIVLAAGVILAGGGTAYAVVGGTATPHYVTVAATTGDVEQTLTLSGLVDAARRSDLSFGTNGTVASVKVAVGDRVTTGQVIATLEASDLDAKVTDAVATQAKAAAQLASDKAAQVAAVQAAASPTTGTTKPTATQSGSGQNGSGQTGATAAVLKALKAEQQAVLEAQSAASAALAAATDALAAQTAACANAYRSAQATSSATPSATPSAGSTPSSDPTGANAACDAALAVVQTQQAVVKDAQDALAKALGALAASLTQALGSATGSNAGPTGGSARTAASPPNGTSSNGSSNGSQTITAARLASDQAQIDQARADLISARAARAQATLRSTRTGKVVSLGIARGDSVSTGTAVAVVVGGKAVTLTGTIPETSVSQVKVGLTARVNVPGSATTTTGTVTAVGMTADTSTGSTTYPVTITVEDPAIALPTGSSAQVQIVLATARNVVTVPISAVTRNGDRAVVRLWDGTTLSRSIVTLGALGARTVVVSSGLKVGQKVVVADADQAVTGASSQLNQRGSFGGPPGTFRSVSGGKGGGPTFSGGPPN